MWKHGGIAGSHRVMLRVLQVCRSCRSGSGNNSPNLSAPVFLSAGGRFHRLVWFYMEAHLLIRDGPAVPPTLP